MPAAFADIVASLSSGGAWPDGAVPEVRATHASVVLLTADRAFKLKRPIDLGFLDYSTLALRRAACDAEVRLNAPRAPGVYLGVRPVVATHGGFRAGGPGEPVEWAVEMVRLPDEACLLHRLERGAVRPEDLARVGRRIASLHGEARRGPEVSRWATFDEVRRNAVDNLQQSRTEVGVTVHSAVHDRLATRVSDVLDVTRERIAARALSAACELHGDLRLDHVYLLDGDRIVLVDGIEFSERLRCGDPVADLAFLTMDLAVRGHDDLADAVAEGWFEVARDEGGRALLPFYESYRSAVRAKVAGILVRDPALDPASRAAAVLRAERHWLWAHGTLERPDRRPCLVGVAGLPGTGKSTLARRLAETHGFDVVRSDVVRRAVGAVRYTEAAKDAVYDACLEQATTGVRAGRRVIVDATFSRERWRSALRARARDLGVPCVVLECRADPARVRVRLEERRGDASEATVPVYQRAARTWEPGDTVAIAADEGRAALAAAEAALRTALEAPRRYG